MAATAEATINKREGQLSSSANKEIKRVLLPIDKYPWSQQASVRRDTVNG